MVKGTPTLQCGATFGIAKHLKQKLRRRHVRAPLSVVQVTSGLVTGGGHVPAASVDKDKVHVIHLQSLQVVLQLGSRLTFANGVAKHTSALAKSTTITFRQTSTTTGQQPKAPRGHTGATNLVVARIDVGSSLARRGLGGQEERITVLSLERLPNALLVVVVVPVVCVRNKPQGPVGHK